MKRSIVSGVCLAIACLTFLLAGGCASRQVKCDHHLVPINVPHSKRAQESLK